MSSNFFKRFKKHDEAPITRRWSRLLLIPGWVIVGFAIAQLSVLGIVQGLSQLGVRFTGINEATLSTLVSAAVYALTLVIVLLVPYWIKKVRTSREELGLTGLPTWTDILISPAGLLVYLVLTGILSSIAMQVLPFYDVTEVQETGFGEFGAQYEYYLAFFSLVVLAPIAEEIVFRGYLFGKLRKHVPVWIAVIATSAVFALAHGAWNVGVDVFALSIVLCVLRLVTGSLWAPILLHMIKNGIAFYLLFINPML